MLIRRADPPPAAELRPPDRTPAPADGAAPLPRGTSPTWELEMLLSGAVTVGLFQAPAQVHRLLAIASELGSAAASATAAVAVTILGAIYALLGAFVLHLATRAYWVGLVGLDSVFPRGIQWDRLKTTGPITRAVYEERVPRLRPLIDRLDNFAASIFSVAFLVVMMCALGALGSAIGFGLGVVATRAVGGDPRIYAIVLAAAIIVGLIVLGVAAVIDKRYGARLAPTSAGARAVRAIAGSAYTLLLARVWSPILYTLVTNIRLRVALPVLYLVLLAAYSAAIVDLLTWEGLLRWERHAYFPAALNARSVDPLRYGGRDASDERGGGLFAGARGRPRIQADVVTEPYVKLFVPYDPDRDDVRLRAACPGLPPLQRVGMGMGPVGRGTVDTSAVGRVLDCFARVRPVTLNGRPLAPLAYRFTTEPATGERGVIAYIPTEPLPRGPNELAVGAIGRDGKALPAFLIPFWK